VTSGLPLDATSMTARQGLRDRVYDLVLDMLMGSRLEPGSRLAIDQIARELHVSPTPVREALVQLERTGLVAREAHKGYRVAPPIAGVQLEALFDARIVLEGGATALAHEETTRRIRASGDGGDMPVGLIRDYFVVDWDFHHRVFEAAGNPFLLDMSEAISTRVHRMRQTMRTGVHDADDAVREHRAVIDAVADGPEAAAAAMRAHIERVRERSRRDADDG
jgi:DNA-binding GntR family transcriptional regulator